MTLEPTWSVLALAVALASGGCGPKSEASSASIGDDSQSASASGDTGSGTLTDLTSSSGSSSGTASGSTGSIEDPEAYCGQFDTAETCSFWDLDQGVFCEWMEVLPASLEDGACVVGSPIGRCFALTGATTAGGCAPPEGCDGDPFFLEVDGTVAVYTMCGGSGPFGGEPCTDLGEGEFEPPECGCLCGGER
jgi:hypothetical protein